MFDQPGRWHQILILREATSLVMQGFGTDLMLRFEEPRRGKGVPADAEVWAGWASNGDKVFYFSPAASDVVGSLLRNFHAAPLAGKPDLSGFKRLEM